MSGKTESAPAVPRSKPLRFAVGIARRLLIEPHLLFPVFAFLLLLVVWSAVIHLIGVERVASNDLASHSSQELADTYQAQLDHNLATIDQTLKTVQYTFETQQHASLADLIAHQILPLSDDFTIATTDAEGHVRDILRRGSDEMRGTGGNAAVDGIHDDVRITLGDTDTRLNVADRPFFAAYLARRHADLTSPSALYVGQLGDDGIGDGAVLTFSRRLQDRHGAFAGVVMLSVSPRYFTNGYDASKVGTSGLLMLVGTDGVVRAERQGATTSSGRVLPLSALRDQTAPHGKTATVQSWDNGTARFTSVRALPDFDLIALVGLDASAQKAQFRADRRNYLIWAIAGTITLLQLTFIFSRMGWQLSTSRRKARQVQRTYYAASEASLDAFITLRTVYAADRSIAAFVIDDTNRRGLELIGTTRDALIGTRVDAVFQQTSKFRTFDALVKVALTGVMDEREWQHERPDGNLVWLHRQVVRVDGGLVGIIRDISGRKLADARRAEQNRVLEMIATSTPLEEVLSYMMRLLEAQIEGALCAVLLRDEDGLHLKLGAAPNLPEAFINGIHGVKVGPEEDIGGRTIHTLRPVFLPTDRSDEALATFTTLTHQYALHDYACAWAYPILSHEQGAPGAVGALTIYLKHAHHPSQAEADAIEMVTQMISIAIERSLIEERIRHMANHDALTGLPNRTLLSDRLNQVLLHAQRYGRSVTVMFIDLDNFKLINDSLGHRAGDDLLKAVASRMAACVRRTDTVVRLGGDEFVIVLYDQAQDRKSVTTTIEKIRQAIGEPVKLHDHHYQVTCSLGLASYPADGEDAETLLMNADAAMYRAKELGRNNYQAYTPDMNVKVHEKLRMQEQLRHALANGEFSLVYQPQVDLKSERVFGVEALLRWHHPTDGMISPADFIPLAEESRLIIPIGEWVLQTACKQNKAWQDAGFAPMTMSVNVSASQFTQQDWSVRVAEALRISGMEARYLELEITESVIMLDLEGAVTTMRALAKMGVHMSIDDFGTGYSSLSALKHFPIGRLKIDQSFVRALSDGQDDRAITMAVISLARQLNLNVIAEGVETHEQMVFLRDNDCHEIQGYHYSRPIPPAEIEALLRAPFQWPAEAGTATALAAGTEGALSGALTGALSGIS